MFFHRSCLILTLAAGVSACDVAVPLPIEQTLDRGEATELLRESPNASQQTYGLRQLERLAARGDRSAMMVVAGAYRRGEGVEADPARAVTFYEMAAAAGDLNARRVLIRYYLDESGEFYAPERAETLHSELVDAGTVDDRLAFAAASNDADSPLYDPARAVRLYEALDAEGADVWLVLSELYLDPEGQTYDPIRGIALLEREVAADTPDAYMYYGRQFLRGTSVERDFERANVLFREGAALGSTRARLQFAISQIVGRGMPANRRAGLEELYQTALETDNAGALLQLIQFDAPEYYVSWLQQKLMTAGYYGGSVNGRMDTATRDAAELWCAEKGIALDCAVSRPDRETVVAILRGLR